PVQVAPHDRLTDALAMMREKDFSQLPVYSEGGYHGLLTTNTVARWFANAYHADGGVVDDPLIDDVLKAQEETPVVDLNRNVSTTEVVAEFQAMQDKGTPLQAVIISDAGKETQAPLAIIVASDLAKLIDK